MPLALQSIERRGIRGEVGYCVDRTLTEQTVDQGAIANIPTHQLNLGVL
jgi:hypothetical protein